MDANAPLTALLQKVDFILRNHGEDPELITVSDKLGLALQYVEVAHREGLTITNRSEIYHL